MHIIVFSNECKAVHPDPWVFFRKGKLGGSDLIISGSGLHGPNVSEIARQLFKSRPCCKRNGYGTRVYSVTFSY